MLSVGYFMLVLTALCALTSSIPAAALEKNYADFASYRDEAGDGFLRTRDILNGTYDGTWQALGSNKVNFGYTRDRFWYVIQKPQIGRLLQQGDILLFRYGLLDEVHVYGIDAQGNVVQHKAAGKVLPLENRDFQNRDLSFDLRKFTGLEKIYISLETTGGLSVAWDMISLKDYADYVYRDSLGIFLYVGMAAIMLLYNFFLYVQTRKFSYVIYIGFAFSMFCMVGSLQAFTYQFLWPSLPSWNRIAGMFSACAMGFMLATMTLHNFKRELKRYTFVKKFLVFFRGWIVFVMLLILIDVRIANVPAMVSMMVESFFLLLFYIYLAKQGNRQGAYYTASMGAVTGVGILFPLRQMGLLPDNFWTANAPMLASGFEMAMISLALGDKYREIEKSQIETLDKKVNERTAVIRGVLDLADSAIFLLKRLEPFHFVISDTPSKKSIAIFGDEQQELNKFSPLQSLRAMIMDSQKDELESMIEALDICWHEDVLNFEINEQLMELVFRLKNSRYLKVYCRPVMDRHNTIDAFVMSVTDVTEAFNKEKASHRAEALEVTLICGPEQAKRQMGQIQETQRVLSRIQRDLAAVSPSDAFVHLQTLLGNLYREAMMSLHTLKGVSRSFSFSSLASRIHVAEEHILRLKGDSKIGSLSPFSNRLAELLETLGDYEWAYKSLHRNQSLMIREGTSLQNLFMQRIVDLAEIAQQRKNVCLEGHYAGVERQLSESEEVSFQGILTHLIRNSIDHGIQDGPLERGVLIIRLNAEVSGTIAYEDSGEGLNLTKIEEKAQRLGMAFPADPLGKAELIFAPGFSTRDRADDISGRGMGMAAVAESMLQMGYSSAIELVALHPAGDHQMVRVRFVFTRSQSLQVVV